MARYEARYDKEMPHGVPSDRSNLSKTAKVGCTLGAVTLSEHLSFQTVLRWVWDKQKLFDPSCELPAHVEQALQACVACAADPQQPCDAMTKLSSGDYLDAPVTIKKRKASFSASETVAAKRCRPGSSVCLICGGIHSECPFMPQLPQNSEAGDVAKFVGHKMQLLKKNNELSLSQEDIDSVIEVPPDGNCLFTAMSIARH